MMLDSSESGRDPRSESRKTVREEAHEEVQMVLAFLDEKLQSADARIGQIETAIGRYAGFFRDLRRPSRRGSIRVVDLMATLKRLNQDPAVFFAQALGKENLIPTTPCAGTPPPLVERAHRRLVSRTPGSLDRPYLEELDTLRFRDPERVVRLAEDAVDFVVPEAVPFLLGVAGSAWRILIRLDEAEHALQAGLEIARDLGNTHLEGELLQRMAYVFADRGDHERALTASKEASVTFLLADDLPSVGRTLVDQGIFNAYLDHSKESIAAYGAALKHLAPNDHSNRFAALQGLGVVHEALGDLEPALSCIRQALELDHEIEPFHLGKLRWLEGNIALRLGRPELGEAALREAVRTLRPIHPVDSALATIELVRLLLRERRPEDAYETAAGMLKLLEPLRRQRNQLVSAAIADLLRHGRQGFDLALVERVAHQIRNERVREVRPRPSFR